MSAYFYEEWLEQIHLLWINLVVKKRNLIEYLKVIFRYYPNKKFMKLDLALLLKYFFKSPFKISKHFMQERGEKEIHVYGETPLTTLQQIAEICEISAEDHVFELGCGRGRGCFWLNAFLQCKVTGIEFIPEFVQRAQSVKEKYHAEGVEFYCEDILVADYSSATVLYLYGTCFDSVFIKKVIKRLKPLKRGTKIITVSYTLNEYMDKPRFNLMKQFKAQYTWGEADVYLQVIP